MYYDSQKLISFAADAGVALGMSGEEALHFAKSLVWADMRGMGSHGLMRMSAYVKRVESGLVQVGVQPQVEADGGALLTIDGRNGMGAYIAFKTMQVCMERAKNTGVCIGAVRNCNHFGCSAYFTGYAAENHMIGFAMSNAYRNVAPFGGSEPMLGTNPLSIAIPAGSMGPFLLDMATSQVAQGKIIRARKEGKSIPLGWGVDKNGEATTDPVRVLEGGTLLPFGGAKGYGISLMIEALCVCLAGGAASTEMGSLYDWTCVQNTGFVLGAVDVRCVMDPAVFERRAEELFDRVKRSDRAAGTEEIFIPGEIEEQKFCQAQREGVELPEVIVQELTELGQRLGVVFPGPKA